MMNKLKSAIAKLALLIMVFSCLALLCACGEAELTEIYVGKDGLPKKTTYVEGQELNLAGGFITTVNEDGETSIIPMTAETVTVTGYDKSVVGKQSLTVTYAGKTTTFDVTVVGRSSADNYELNYFVGDEFDKTKGKLKIYRDDATSFSVNIADSSVQILSFDSSKAGKVTVSVKYTSADGTEYTVGFDVTVHDIAQIEFVAPTKKVYNSHEKLDVKGGYFTVKAGNGSDFSKHVNITENMISGFKPELVTKENLKTPAKQTVVFSYAQRQFEFPVDIYYSGVYLIQSAAQTLSFYDWTDENVEVNDEFGEIALEAIKQYYSLSGYDQNLIDIEDIETVVRPAAIYLHNLYIKEFERFSDVFRLTSSGFAVIAKSYEAVEQACENLKTEDDAFNVYAELLREVYDEFGDVEYDESTKLSSKIFVHTEEYHDMIITTFTYMLELYDMLAEFPDEWDLETIAENEDMIVDTVAKITNSGYGGYQNAQIYQLVSAWRTNNDFLEIIYSYYMYVLDGGRDELGQTVWKVVPLPGVLRDWYMAFSQAYSEASNMDKYQDSTAYLRDTSIFMHYYFKALKLADDVKNHANPLYNDIYTLLGGDVVEERDLRGATFGYLYHMGAGLDCENILTLWDNYLTLLDVFMTNSSLSTKEYGEQFENIFASLVELSPAELYDFISSLHFLYNTSKGVNLVFESREGVRSYFVYILAAYYSTITPESNFKIFQKMLLAMESYALVGTRSSALADFKSFMEEIAADYKALSTVDQATFDKYFGDCYDKYMLIYELETDKKDVALGDYEDKFSELKSLIEMFNEISAKIEDSETPDDKKNELVPVLFAIYEKANSIRKEIISSRDAEIIEAFGVLKFTFEDGDKTLDKEICRIRKVFISYLTNSFRTIDEVSYRAWYVYSQSNIDAFLVDIAYLMIQGYKVTSVNNVGNVYQIMADYRAMSAKDKQAFVILGFANTYYAGLQIYFESVFDDSQIVKAILEADIAYALYEVNVSDENLNSFIEKFEALQTIYEGLDDKAAFEAVFKALYDYYLEQYTLLTAEPTV